jgi:uncharacterized RDD family membrane protein YckC
MTEQKIDSGTRLGSMILDHVLMTMIAMVFFIPGMISGFVTAFNVSHDQTSPDFFGNMYLGLSGFALYFCKDCINGRSIAKRILKLQIVDNTTGLAASPLKCFVRNIFCVLWPIEVVVALINKNRRIGDRVAGTKLISFDPALEQPKLNFGQLALALGLAYALILLIMLPFNSIKSEMEAEKIIFVESSLNTQEGKKVEQLFSDSLGQYMTADVRVYDKIHNKDLKYVSVILQLKENYMSDDDAYEQLKGATVPLLLTIFPEKTFVGRIQYVFKTDGSMQTRRHSLDWRTTK